MEPDPKVIGRPDRASLSPAGEERPRLRLSNLFYSIPHAQRLLGDISKATAYRLIAAEKLDARKILGKTVVTGESIEKLAAELPPSGARRTTAMSAAEPAQRPRQPSPVGASQQPEPTASGKMGPEADGRGPRLRRGRSRSLQHRRDRADQPARADSSG
jgi:Helix-turn-helix domain